jgi:phosphate transport system substrate-binding protein
MPLYLTWAIAYERIDPTVYVDYQSIGSGAGVRQLSARTVAFGASDVALSDAEMAQLGVRLLHVPAAAGAIAVAYHLPGSAARRPLQLDPERLAGIFLGEIRRWNDPRLEALNPGVPLPDRPIVVVQRSDGSGTTAVLSHYLAAHSPRFRERVGTGMSLRWPVGVGAKGSEGVSGLVRSTPYALGYMELTFARQARLPCASLRNAAGRAIQPSPESVRAATLATPLPDGDELRIDLLDPPASGPGAIAYPLSTYTYLLLDRDASEPVRTAALVRFVSWTLADGQRLAPSLGYVPVPAPLAERARRMLGDLSRAAAERP